MKTSLLAAVCALLALPAAAAVRYVPQTKTWVLETAHTSYALGLNGEGQVQHIYWGSRIGRDEDFGAARRLPDHSSFDPGEGEEYPGWGGMRYAEPCLKITFDGGVRDLVLKYVSHETGDDALTLRLKDIRQDLFVELQYRVFAANDIVRKSVRIVNRTGKPVMVDSAQSGLWRLPADEGYRLSYLAGRWAAETQLIREAIHPGRKVLESRRGNTSHQLNPWFAIDYKGQADETHGRVWFGALGWSGNWKMTIEQSSDRQVTVVGGYNDFDSATCSSPANRSTRRRSMADTRVRASARLRASCTASCAGSFCPTARIRTRAPCFTTRGK
ncbi:MAG: glycoside hydrolase family 36 N-terminal domain-containing protein [Acidobacteriota bacterium]